MHLEKVIPQKYAQLGLFVKVPIQHVFWNNFVWVHFVTKVRLYFWNLRKIMHLLIPILSRLLKKIPPLCSVLYNMTQINTEAVT
jgi:hypothetical protein